MLIVCPIGQICSSQLIPAANKKCWMMGMTLTCERSAKSSSYSSWLVQLRIRLLLKTKIPAAKMGSISSVSKPIILSQSKNTWSTSMTPTKAYKIHGKAVRSGYIPSWFIWKHSSGSYIWIRSSKSLHKLRIESGEFEMLWSWHQYLQYIARKIK